jgi:Ca2+/H+ antiporter, TMEM165/GDT1 family
MNAYVMAASFLGTSVEFVEALTIILAVGVVKGWKSSLLGALAATLLLTLIVLVFGSSLIHLVDLSLFQTIVGICMVLFGMRWLHKAILRYSGHKALHDEEEAYQKEVERQAKNRDVRNGIDWFGFSTSFNGVLLEGVESVFIVLTFGLAAKSLSSAIIGSVIGLVLVVFAGIILHRPLTKVPENTMKFVVGVMLSSFGIFWTGEGIGISWWHEDVFILIIAALLLFASFIFVHLLKEKGVPHSEVHEKTL